MPKLVRNILLSTILACVSAKLTLATPQHEEHAQDLPVLVDGAKNPEAIPDTIAYRHLALSLATYSAPGIEEISRRDSQLKPIGLSADDENKLLLGLKGLKEQLDGFERQRTATIHVTSLSALTDAQSAALNKLRDQEHGVIDNVRAIWRSSLSPAGQEILDSYIRNHVKKHIVIYGY